MKNMIESNLNNQFRLLIISKRTRTMNENETEVSTVNLDEVQQYIEGLFETGSYDRDEIKMEVAIKYRVPGKIVDKLIKNLDIRFSKTTNGYRQWSAEAFLENPGITKKEWEKGISHHLSDITNYRQIFDLLSAIANKRLMK